MSSNKLEGLKKMSLKFYLCDNEEDILEVVNFNNKAFSDIPQVEWSLDSIKHEMGNKWKLIAVESEEESEIIAVLFVKLDGDMLHTKNTSIKLPYQGQGCSHEIKEFYEEYAIDNSAKKIANVCHNTDFRTISLNEKHGYKKNEDSSLPSDSEFVEWKKVLGESKAKSKNIKAAG